MMVTVMRTSCIAAAMAVVLFIIASHLEYFRLSSNT